MFIHVQYLDSHGMFSISSETKTMREVPLLTEAIDNRLFLFLGADRDGDGDAKCWH